MNVIGISAFNHDAACALLIDGMLVAAAEEERFSRIKHDRSLPVRAFAWCLEQAELQVTDIDVVGYFEDPCKKLSRQLWSGLPNGFRHWRSWLDGQRPTRDIRERLGFEGEIEIVDHHLSHAASAYCYSGFSDAAILTVDGVGEWLTSGLWHGKDGEIEFLEGVDFPDSLGLLYSTITAYLGFGVNDGEYKVMGLAPYGKQRYRQAFEELVSLDANGTIRLNPEYFDFLVANRMYTEKLPQLFGVAPRRGDEPLTNSHADIAAGLQARTEQILLAWAERLHRLTGERSLCIAGGLALNCVANGRLRREGPFDRMFVQPAAGDSGGALGAAAIAYQRRSGRRISGHPLEHVYLGPQVDECINPELLACGACDYRHQEDELMEQIALRISEGAIVGWVDGRMEFGPRALGARSILADPRDPEMRERINARVKRREAFRPFAPAVLVERVQDWFDLEHPSPFMTETCRVDGPEPLPAVTHVDGSARVQTVDRTTAPRLARLLAAFERRTGCPVLLNTSFNIKGMPIVLDAADAIDCFLRAGLDLLVMNNIVLERKDLSRHLARYLRDCRSRPAEERGESFPVYTFF